MKNKHSIEDLLSHFDSTITENPFLLRCSVTPLYEFYNKILFQVGRDFCGYTEELLIKYGLKTRWNFISVNLRIVEECKQWDKIINKLDFDRNEVSHNDKYIPKIEDMKKIRDSSTDFMKFTIEIGKKYQEKSKNFTFKEHFYDNLFFNLQDGNALIKEFGNTPFIAFEHENLWNEFLTVIGQLYSPIMKANKLDELNKSQLDNLLYLSKLIGRFRGREDMTLHFNRCPKCGGNIRQTTHPIGYKSDDSDEPTGEKYRMGCDKCNYTLDEGTEYF